MKSQTSLSIGVQRHVTFDPKNNGLWFHETTKWPRIYHRSLRKDPTRKKKHAHRCIDVFEISCFLKIRQDGLWWCFLVVTCHWKNLNHKLHMGLSKNRGTPKWMVYFIENPLFFNGWFGEKKNTIFGKKTSISEKCGPFWGLFSVEVICSWICSERLQRAENMSALDRYEEKNGLVAN